MDQYRIELQRRGDGDWYTHNISPHWYHANAPIGAGIQALERYLASVRETVADLVAADAEQLRILVTPMQRASRPDVFTLHDLLEYRVRREAAQLKADESRVQQSKVRLKAAVADAAAAGIPQHVLVRQSGWSRETLRKHARNT
ncbi:hypothetical protein [Streptomyces sp.]|uniref:hypothetical protein n=1 Tax=Streptomyces sp. TaxID=1931 RepID=UPI002D7668D7|nr:hypothetical protein [Streptomyces sp.]HET6356319.1 hypothetical protein [Streptomyces sp.]